MKKILLLSLILSAGILSAQETEVAVGVSSSDPFCFYDSSQQPVSPHGFDIDVLNEIAHHENWNIDYKVYDTFGSLLDAARNGDVDMAVSGISHISSREPWLDFSVPVYDSGYQLVTLVDTSWVPNVTPTALKMFVWVLIISVILIHLLWLADRKGDSGISPKYFWGIGDAAEAFIHIASTVGLGNRAPCTAAARILQVPITLIGITFFGLIAGSIIVDFDARYAKHGIETMSDVRNDDYVVGAVAETSSAQYFSENGIDLQLHQTQEQLVLALSNEEVTHAVFDKPVALYMISKYDELIETGELMQPHSLAFAFPEDSELIEQVNQNVLRIREDGRYDKILAKYFE